MHHTHTSVATSGDLKHFVFLLKVYKQFACCISNQRKKIMKIEIGNKVVTEVKPAEMTPRRSLWLSELDLLNLNMHTPTIYFYKNNGSTNFFDPAVLKEALSKVLVPFYPMAGRFKLDDDGRLEIDCNGEGVLFIEAECNSAVDDFGDFAPMLDLKKLIPSVDYSGGISSYPFMVAQVTRFKCGGMSLGLAIEHQIADGPAAIHFVNSWADIAHGLELKTPPFLDRTILSPRDPPQPKFDHIEYENTPILYKTPLDHVQSSTVVVFRITKEQINILKTKAIEDGDFTTNYSTFEVLAGHVWKCTCIARGVPNDIEARLYFPVNGRYSRLKPPLPDGYFGNVVFTTTATSLAGDLQSKPLFYAASRVRKALERMSNDYLRSAIDYLALHPGTKRYGTRNFITPNFSITSWVRMPTHEADFGWGRPRHMGSGGLTHSEGKATILPTETQDQSLQVVIGLQFDHMKVFENLFYAI